MECATLSLQSECCATVPAFIEHPVGKCASHLDIQATSYDGGSQSTVSTADPHDVQHISEETHTDAIRVHIRVCGTICVTNDNSSLLENRQGGLLD